MAEISLRAYLDYIEDRLARDAYSEVVAQCRHILETYPKQTASYRLMARALAAQDEIQDALDLYQRVLSTDPRDFASHIGMSEAYRENNALDQAIWHLERAFEQVPNNADLQEEIKNLYVQRGDKAPRKIHLTSGALAHMYYKGKLYDQAIAELRAGIAKDPERLDLQVLLAQALWDNHQEMNAGRVAAEILNRLPYSIDANSILARLWLKYGRPAEARPFLERVSEVDPLEGYRVGHNGEEPPTDEFRMVMLDYSAAHHAVQSGAADWVSQISAIEKQKGVTGPLGAPKQPASITDIFLTSEPEPSAQEGGLDEHVPDWLQSAISNSQAQRGQQPGSTSRPVEEAPDWLQEALGKTSDSPESLPPVESGPETAAAKADPLMDSGTPDWLQEALGEPSGASSPAAPSEDTPDWLQEALGEPSGAPSPVAPSEDTPDWLQEALGQGGASQEQAPVEEGTPLWMQEALDQKPMFTPDEATAPSEPTTAETPAWLQEIRASEPQSDTPDALRTDLDDVPDWLGEILSEAPGAGDAPDPKQSEETVGEVSDEWLDDFLVGGPPITGATARTAGSVPASEPLDAEPVESRMLAPDEDAGELETWDAPLPPSEDWLAQPSGVEAPAEATESAASEPEPLPDWLQTDHPSSEEKPTPVSEAAGEEDALPAWLNDMPDTEPVMAVKGTDDQEDAAEEEALPDWLRGSSEVAPVMAKEEEPAEQEPGLPDWLIGSETVEADRQPEPIAQADEGKDLPSWLQDAKESDEEQPDWLRALSAEDAEEPESELLEEPAAVYAETPASEEESQVAPPNDEPMGENDASDIPDWMLDGDLDSDDAVAWLEDLAAKYDPEFKRESEIDSEGTEAEPAGMEAAAEPAAMTESVSDEEEEEDELAWLRSPTEDTEPIAEAESGADDALPSWLTADDEMEDEAKPAAAPSAEDALSWLDSQVTQQGVSTVAVISEALTPDHPPTDAAPPPPLDAEAEPASDDELPEWLRGEDVEAEIERAGSGSIDEPTELPEPVVEDEELAWLDEALKAEEIAVSDEEMESLMGETQGDDALPDWLSAMGEEEAEAEPAPAAAVVEEEEEPAAAIDEEEEEEEEPLPAWLAEDAEEPTAAPPPAPEPPVVELPEEGEPLPAWLQGTTETADAGLDEFLKAVVPAARESDRAPAPPPAAPPPPEPMVIGTPPTQAPAAPVSSGPAGPGLEAARSKMSDGYTDDSLAAYEDLVKSRESLDETIADLTEYTKGSRPNPRAYRVIGDAFMAQGKLNDALAMYQKALDQF